MEQRSGTIETDFWEDLKAFSKARIAMGRCGAGLPTDKVLEFRLAHAQARDAVWATLDVESLLLELEKRGWASIHLKTAATDRQSFLKRPDLGRMLCKDDRLRLQKQAAGAFTLSIVIGDGLSAAAIAAHALPFLEVFIRKMPQHWTLAPIAVVEQARIAVADEIAEMYRAELSIVLIGERPGLSTPDSMGLYLCYHPKVGRQDAEKNCISNIHAQGLSYEIAADKALYLLQQALVLQLSGVQLKDESDSNIVEMG